MSYALTNPWLHTDQTSTLGTVSPLICHLLILEGGSGAG